MSVLIPEEKNNWFYNNVKKNRLQDQSLRYYFCKINGISGQQGGRCRESGLILQGLDDKIRGI